MSEAYKCLFYLRNKVNTKCQLLLGVDLFMIGHYQIIFKKVGVCLKIPFGAKDKLLMLSSCFLPMGTTEKRIVLKIY